MENNTIIQIFDYIADKLGIVIDWTQENLQPYLSDLFNRWVSYEIAAKWIAIILCIAFIAVYIVTVRFSYKAWKIAKKCERSNIFYEYYHIGQPLAQTWWFAASIIGTAIGLVCIIFLFISIFDLIKLYTVPEVTLYELVIA